jgi:hypothetical protein
VKEMFLYSTVSTLKPGERGSCREEVGEEAEASEKKRRRRSKGEEKKRKKDSSGDEKTLSLSLQENLRFKTHRSWGWS